MKKSTYLVIPLYDPNKKGEAPEHMCCSVHSDLRDAVKAVEAACGGTLNPSSKKKMADLIEGRIRLGRSGITLRPVHVDYDLGAGCFLLHCEAQNVR